MASSVRHSRPSGPEGGSRGAMCLTPTAQRREQGDRAGSRVGGQRPATIAC